MTKNQTVAELRRLSAELASGELHPDHLCEMLATLADRVAEVDPEPVEIYLSEVDESVVTSESNIFADGPHAITTRTIMAQGSSNDFGGTRPVVLHFPSKSQAEPAHADA